MMQTRIIDFHVTGQEIACSCTDPAPRGDVQLYLQARFFSDALWGGLKLLAIFIRKGRGFSPCTVPLDETMTCDFPPALLVAPDGGGTVYIHVGLVGLDPRGGGYRLTTGRVAVRINPSCYVQGQTPYPPTPNVYEDLLKRVKDAEEIDPEKIRAAIDDYLQENPIDVQIMTEDTAGIAKVGDNLKIDAAGRLSVDTADEVEGDNTRPITAAAVYSTVGNIEILLGTI